MDANTNPKEVNNDIVVVETRPNGFHIMQAGAAPERIRFQWKICYYCYGNKTQNCVSCST